MYDCMRVWFTMYESLGRHVALKQTTIAMLMFAVSTHAAWLLQVRVANVAAPFVGSWTWMVSKAVSRPSVELRPASTVYDDFIRKQVDMAVLAGQDRLQVEADLRASGAYRPVDTSKPTTADVKYVVTYTRNPPQGFVSGVPAFQVMGDALVSNSAPLTAQLHSVLITIHNPTGGLPYTTTATCPMLTVSTGQTLSCRWVATPSFNPVGAQIRATARYLNAINGVLSGKTTDYNSPTVTIPGAATQPGPLSHHRRTLLQTSGAAPGGGSSSITTTTTSNAIDPVKFIQNLFGASQAFVASGGSNANPFAPAPSPSPKTPAPSTTITISSGGAGGGSSNAAARPAGDTVVAAAAPTPAPPPPANTATLQGLQDECIDISDGFQPGNETVQGAVISGNRPTGRICGTTTFVYTVRFGTFNSCFTKNAVNTADYVAADTKTRGNSKREVEVTVSGCTAHVMATIDRVRAKGSAAYAWSVAKSSSPTSLMLMAGLPGIVRYSINYQRTVVAVGAVVNATVTIENIGFIPITVDNFEWRTTTTCDKGPTPQSGVAQNCLGRTVPPSKWRC